MAMTIAWPDKPKWTKWPPISFAVRYGLAPASITLARALARVFLYFHWPQPFTGLALSAIAITFRCGSTKSGFIATLIASVVRDYFLQPEISVTARLVYDPVFLLFALLMMGVTQDQNKLEVKVVEQNAELAHANEILKRAELKSRKFLSARKALVAACMRDVRSLSYLLYPPLLDPGGLEDAIRDYVQGFTERSGIRVALELSAGVGRMARDVELTLFRVVQEGLTNIQRHSGSDQAEIRIQRNSDLLLEIIDHGDHTSHRAPKAEEQSPYKIAVGILRMQQRVKLIGGQLDISRTIRGTTVAVRLPYQLSTNGT